MLDVSNTGGLTYVTLTSHPALLADALPGFMTRPVEAAGEGYALVARGTLPTWSTSESKGKRLNNTIVRKLL